MGETRKKPGLHHHKPNIFSCFGFSSKPRISKKITWENSGALQVEDEEDDDGGFNRNYHTKKSKRWFSWARKYRLKKSESSNKTVVVPVDYSTSSIITTEVTNKDKVHATKFTSKSLQKAKTDSKLVYKPKTSSTSNGNSSEIGPNHQPTSRELKRAQTVYGTSDAIVLDHGKHLDLMNSSKPATCQNSFYRKIEAIRTGISHTGPLEAKPRSTRTLPLPRSVTMPIIGQEKPVKSTRWVKSSLMRRDDKGNAETVHKKPNSGSELFVGLSIMVALMIMVLCGKLCAILCTCAWFYFIPLMNSSLPPHQPGTAPRKESGLSQPDFDSMEYKKKVILEGLPAEPQA